MSCENSCVTPKSVLSNNGVVEIATHALNTSRSGSDRRSIGTRKSDGYNHDIYCDTAVFKAALEVFATKCGHPGIMPNRSEIVREHEWDLLREVYFRGGWDNTVHDTGLQKEFRTRDYVNDLGRLIKDLLQFVADHGNQPTMPDKETLESFGERYLARAIGVVGEIKVARMCGLELGKRKEPGYWYDFQNLERELNDFIQEHGIKGRSPKLSELERYGKKIFATPDQIFWRNCGGFKADGIGRGLETS